MRLFAASGDPSALGAVARLLREARPGDYGSWRSGVSNRGDNAPPRFGAQITSRASTVGVGGRGLEVRAP
jgi:hypothetical protein